MQQQMTDDSLKPSLKQTEGIETAPDTPQAGESSETNGKL